MSSDKYITRQFLTQPDIARDFMELHLPAELQAICDLCTLKLESGLFVEDGQYCSDFLYSDCYGNVLIEDQSPPDRHMAFRLIRYAMAAMQRYLEAGAGWMSLTTRRWQANSTAALSRW